MAIEYLDDLKTRVDALSLGYVCKVGSLNPNADTGIALIPTGGPSGELGFGTAGLLFEFPHVMVMVRGAPDDYDGPHAVIDAIYKDLPKVQGTALASGTVYHTITPLQAPFIHDRRDDKGRTVWMVNFEVKKEVS